MNEKSNPVTHIMTLLATALLLSSSALLAEVHVYDLTIKVAAKTLMEDPATVKVAVVGTMTFDDVTGAVTFQATEDTEVPLFGEGLLGVGPKLQAFGKTTFNAGDMLDPWYTGTAFFVGKFGKGFTKFSGKFYAICDSFGDPPQGYTFNTGKVKAIERQ